MNIFWGKNAELALYCRARCRRNFYSWRLRRAVVSTTSERRRTTFSALDDSIAAVARAERIRAGLSRH